MVMNTLFFFLCLLISTLVNKNVLVVYDFPSFEFLALFRMLGTILVLGIGRHLQFINFPSLDRRIVRTLLPLPVLYSCLMITGLIYTIRLTRLMAAVSRRFITLMTMILEQKMLGVSSCRSIQFSIVTMMIGAIVTAGNDLYLVWYGAYIIILINNIISALNAVYLKKILDTEELNIWGLLFYDACFMIAPDFLVCWASTDFEETIDYHLNEKMFWWHLLLSCLVEMLTTYSVMLCTQMYSAFTATAILNVWSIFVTFFMVVFLGRGLPTWNMYFGYHIGLIGGIVYIYSHFTHKSNAHAKTVVSTTKSACEQDIGKIGPKLPTLNSNSN